MGVVDARRRLRSWGRRHSYSFFSSLGALLNNRIGTLMTVLVLGIAILLPLGLFITLDNLNRLDLQQDEWSSVTVFAHAGADETDIRALAAALQERDDIEAVQLVSPKEGMAEFSAASGFGQSLELLEQNPLPWVMMVSPNMRVAGAGQESSSATRLVELLENQPLVASVQYDYKWLQRLGRLLELGRAAVAVLTLLFGMAVIVVVANTIRLDVATRSEEIEILALVGASNSFIRQPFLYSGFWYGILGGALAAGLMKICLFYLEIPLSRLLDAYGQGIEIYGLGFRKLAILLLSSGTLGMLGAWISVQKYLRMLVVGGTLGRR